MSESIYLARYRCRHCRHVFFDAQPKDILLTPVTCVSCRVTDIPYEAQTERVINGFQVMQMKDQVVEH